MNQASENMEMYFDKLKNELDILYDLATKARKKGYDPADEVEINLAKNMAARVEGLIGTVAPQVKGSGILQRIEELEKQYGSQDWRIAFTVALEVAQQKFCKFSDERLAMEVGLRVGLAYITNGVVASPLEGFTKLALKKRKDGKPYFSLFFSGPIRSAGTTATCVFVALADYVRQKMGYEVYDPTEEEVKRMITEVIDFHERITNLQYFPSEPEIEFMIKHLPVQIDGEPSEKIEVSNYKNLERIETNRLRNGIALVIGEGLTQKAAKFFSKFSKWKQDFGITSMDFLEEFVELQKKIKAKSKGKTASDQLVKPDYTFIKDLVAGRPILTYPLRNGGFRLRYGRARNSGFSSDAVHPATMRILNDYLAVGTQLRTERPGKSTVLAVCDTLEGPIVKLKNGDVVLVDTEEKALLFKNKIEEILFLGDILINYGDFLDRGHRLIPCGYNEEWHRAILEKLENKNEAVNELIKNPYKQISGEDAIKMSTLYKIPLHPRYTYHWKNISKKQLENFVEWIKHATKTENEIILPLEYDIKEVIEGEDPKRTLELLGVPHRVIENQVYISGGDCFVLNYIFKDLSKLDFNKEDCLKILNMFNFDIKDKNGHFIGARMGRPEKAKIRKLTGNPHVLFPVGEEGGKMRNLQSALEKGKVNAEWPYFYCIKCNKETIYPTCEVCGIRTQKRYYCYDDDKILETKCEKTKKVKDKEGKEQEVTHLSRTYTSRGVDVNHYFRNALAKLNITEYKDLIKGVKGVWSEDKIPENLVKGILRSIYNIHVNKDGTVRYDMTETALTHFKLKEIGTNIKKIKQLGYDKDIYGRDIVDENQVIELKCQDIILPSCEGSLEEGADKILFRVGRFVDDLLENLYGLSRYYNFKSEEDVTGSLLVALSPHTSAGNLCRVIGFSKTQGFYAHPLLHCMMRRDADGDEACVVLLLDALLNFSKLYLPGHRGARQDAPLVLNFKLIPAEVDDMVFNMDTAWKYPLEFYESAEQFKFPWEIMIETYRGRLGTEKQYEGMGFTHDPFDINQGTLCSAYKTIPSMQDKVKGQMDLAEKIRAVDEGDVARLIIERHFLRDIKGNLRKFSMQQFRCVDCNEKYRRPPLMGKCLSCGGRIIFTIAEGSIIKYLEPSLDLAKKYDLPPYLQQTLELLQKRIESVFGKESEKQEGLNRWFS
ncbi:MAG: DNA polymerase II large subunit [Candidatus Nanoarchaeia archaeon]|nr:DNA polymerase II large subunit [Candidatus Nanoarchaeia archaeon]